GGWVIDTPGVRSTCPRPKERTPGVSITHPPVCGSCNARAEDEVWRPHTGGWVIDTPGVRSFGLGHVVADELLEAFPDLAELAEHCPRGCSHDRDAPDCALDELVEQGGAGTA